MILSLISPRANELQEHSKSVCLPTALLCALHQEQLSHIQACHFLQVYATSEDGINPDSRSDFSVTPRRLGNRGLTLSVFSREPTPGLWFASFHLWTDPARSLPCTMRSCFALSVCLSGCLPSGRPCSHLQNSPQRVTDLLATSRTNTRIVRGWLCAQL